jgi:uncharacterized protein
MKDRRPDPRALDIAALCRDGARLEGTVPLSVLARLATSLLNDADGGSAEVRWSAQGQTRPVAGGTPELWLALRAEVAVRLECQRCLQPMAWPLQFDRRLRFVRGEREAERLDDELDDDVLALEPRIDLLQLVEDELILALPLVPRHDTCPEPLPQPGAAPELPDDEAPAGPFAALAGLRRSRPS